jgi:hypothetical protein
MSRSSKSYSRELEFVEVFEERIDLLFEELTFAIQWQRPSILLVFYESETVRGQAECALKKRLAEIGQQVMQIKVNEKRFDIPLMLSKRKDRNQTIYSVVELSSGGGKAGANAYRALNMRREYFIDYTIRVILWLTGEEAIALSRHAPDFWAFRHRVVELNDIPDQERPLIPSNVLLEGGQGIPGQPKDLDEQIKQHLAHLRDLPKQAESDSVRMELLFALAGLYQTQQAHDQAILRSKQGIIIAKRVNNVTMLAKFWVNLGTIYLELDQPTRAIRAYRKAIRLDPQEVEGWVALGQVYQIKKRITDAIIAYKQVLQLDPQNSPAKSSLVVCYRLLGKESPAEERREKE